MNKTKKIARNTLPFDIYLSNQCSLRQLSVAFSQMVCSFLCSLLSRPQAACVWLYGFSLFFAIIEISLVQI